jgi:ATP-dependent protease ClpP protease subunit
MARKLIKIDTYIGRWGYSKELLRFDLQDTQKDGVVLEISSLGGSAYDAIDMHNQIAQHGNVHVVYTGPSASAATIIGMGAQKISIIDNNFMLVHKVMAVVDNYGAFNEDDLDALIEDLKTLKTENQKFDLAIARIYSKRSGKSIEDTLALMKLNTWLSAEEAIESGLVDEVIAPDAKYNFVSERMVAMVASCELPPLPKNAKSNQNHDMVKFERLNQVLEIDELVVTEDGSYLNTGQLEVIEERLDLAATLELNYDQAVTELNNAREENERLTNELARMTPEYNTGRETLAAVELELEASRAEAADLSTQLDAVTSERENAVTSLEQAEEQASDLRINNAAMLAAVDSLHDTVAAAEGFADKLSAIQSILALVPGGAIPRNLDKKDKTTATGGVDWDTINSLPHNQSVDTNLQP